MRNKPFRGVLLLDSPIDRVSIPHFRSWLLSQLAQANPKCTDCAGKGSYSCPYCDGIGYEERKLPSGSVERRKCPHCVKGSVSCDCLHLRDEQFRVEICGIFLDYEQTIETIESLEAARSPEAYVVASGSLLLIEERRVKRQRRRVEIRQQSMPPDSWQVVPRYSVEQIPLPFME